MTALNLGFILLLYCAPFIHTLHLHKSMTNTSIDTDIQPQFDQASIESLDTDIYAPNGT